MTSFDVIVIGAGLNGLVTALATGGRTLRRPLRVGLVDAKSFGTASTDSRGSALTRATQVMLDTLGLWSALKPHAQQMRKIVVTDGRLPIASRPVLLNFLTGEGQEASAAIVENGVLVEALREAVLSSPAIECHMGVPVTGFAFGPARATVTLDDGKQLKAPLLVAADGRGSRAREAAGLTVQSKPYGQSALTFTIGHDAPHLGQAEEHFGRHGVLAVLPLSGKRSSIVWGETPDRAEALMALPEADFLAAFAETVGSHLGAMRLESLRNCYPLMLQTANALTAHRLALVGDAAHVIHPLAGLGLNLGFKDAAALADCLADELAIGGDIGGQSVLEAYVKLRRMDTMTTTFAIDAMNALFVNDNHLLGLARSTGLQLVDKLPWAKSLFMEEAAGLLRTPPRLMRGLMP
jgi:2-octaprenyl-6-methoxyphenol hydroxylase